jgi:hypothetical protein
LALACLKKVPREALGGHWFILADCYAMLGEPGQCALVWEEHGAEILEAYEGGAQLSPDGRWMVYQSKETGQPDAQGGRLRAVINWTEELKHVLAAGGVR